MKKTLLKTVSIFSLIFCILVGSSFTVFADEITNVDIMYTRTTYSAMTIYDDEYYSTGYNGTYSGEFTNTINIDNSTTDFLRAYIRNNRDGSDSIDESFPIYCTVSKTGNLDTLAIPMSNICFSMDDLTNLQLQVAGSNGGTLSNTLSNILGYQRGESYSQLLSVSYINYLTLYTAGYSVIDHAGFTYVFDNSTAFVYFLAKKKGDDQITFMGNIEGEGTESGSQSGTIGHAENEYSYYMNFIRYDLSPLYIYENSSGDSYHLKSNDYIQPRISCPESYYIYDTNMTINSYINGEYFCSFTSRIENPYIVFAQGNSTEATNTRSSGTINCNVLTVDSVSADYSSQLDSINSNLVTIKDLLSDLQVQEIQNIYNNIENNYDVDVDLELNNYLDDYSDKFNTLNFEDPNINIPTNDVEKVGSFKIIFSNMMDTMNQSGIGILYFLPLVLLIIGAII